MVDQPARDPMPEETLTDARRLGLDAELEQRVVDALEADDPAGVRELVGPLHYADIADLLEHLAGDDRRKLIAIIGDDFHADVLSELDEAVRDDVIDDLEVEDLAAVVSELDTDDAVDIIEELDEEEQLQVLEAIPAGDRTLIEEALTYPEDSAGRLMQREVVTVPTFWTVGEAIDFMRASADEDSLPEAFYDIFVVDPMHRPVGAISLSGLLRTRRPVPVLEIMDPEMKLIPVAMDQEEVAFLFRQRDLVSAPVVGDGGRLVGAITIDDVVDVIDEEHEEDIMRMAGVQEDDLYSAVLATTRSRFTWLLVNLGTAVLASVVIGLFQGTIEQMVALAVLMPIVASMGGNAGTQTLTVAVRGLATREITPTNAFRVMGKELLVGGINGLLFAVITGLVAWLWFSSPLLGVVIGLAMIANLLVAALSGSLTPLVLDRLRIDPAVGSSVILTTVTDVIGFFVFLALGAWLLL